MKYGQLVRSQFCMARAVCVCAGASSCWKMYPLSNNQMQLWTRLWRRRPTNYAESTLALSSTNWSHPMPSKHTPAKTITCCAARTWASWRQILAARPNCCFGCWLQGLNKNIFSLVKKTHFVSRTLSRRSRFAAPSSCFWMIFMHKFSYRFFEHAAIARCQHCKDDNFKIL